MKKALPLLFLLLSSAFAFTQTYSSTTPYNCQPKSYHPITSWSEFECHVVTAESAQYQFFGPSRFEMFTPLNLPYPNTTLMLTNFTQPGNGNAGTYGFNWSGTDQNGVQHTGTASGTWLSVGPNWRGWYWPRLLSNTITVNQY